MTAEKILFVDDDEIITYTFRKDLRGPYEIVAATNGDEALTLLKEQGPFAVLIADMLMPGMNGIELLAEAQQVAPDTVRIMLTGDENKQTAVEAINEGRIFRFLSKPCPVPKLLAAVEAAVKQYRLVIAERQLLEQTLNGSVRMLTELLSAGEPEAFGEGQKMREYVRIVAPSLGFDTTWDIEMAAMLGQVGRMTIPPITMQKVHTGMKLTDREKEIINRIPEIGFTVLSRIPRLESAAKIVLYQNKNIDGSGFPNDGLYKEAIPKGARLIRILTDLVALEAKGYSQRQAIDEMKGKKGLYDQAIVDAVKAALIASEKPVDGTAVKLKELETGLTLLAPVETLDGRLIAAAGMIISPVMLERFHNFSEISGIKEPIFVRDDRYR